MRDRRRTTAAVLAGGVALASAGFAIGSQSDDGSAVAREGTAQSRSAHFGGPGHRGGPGFNSLADELGVSEEKLRQALEDLRPTGDPGDELAAALAQSLGIDRAKVDEALQQLRTQHEQRHERGRNAHAEALGKELGIPAAKVHAAFEKLMPKRDEPRGGPRRHHVGLGTLAKELGVTQAKLRAALREVGPPGPPGRGGPGRHHRGGPEGPGGPGRGGPMADDLAQALGVDVAKVEQALEDFHAAKHDEFAQKLADKLGIDVDKVKEALPPRP